MLLAVCRCLVALDSEARSARAGLMCAKLVIDVDHAIFSMLLAEHRLLALDIEVRSPPAGVI